MGMHETGIRPDAAGRGLAQGLSACHDCDLLLAPTALQPGEFQACPRCGSIVREGKPDSRLRALALSSTGLILFAPAVGLPLLSMSVMGLRQEASLMRAVLSLFEGGFPEVGLAVLVSTVLAPFANLWLMFSVSLSLTLSHRPRWLARLLRVNHRVREWAMIEVFLFGVLISVVKLKDMGQLVPGTGLYCFAGLMLSTLLLESLVDEHEFWQELDHAGH